MAQTLQLAAYNVPIHWIVVENGKGLTDVVAGILHRSGLSYEHRFNAESRIVNTFKAGDVRNEGIRYLRSLKPPPHPDSTLYFAGKHVFLGWHRSGRSI